MPFNPSIARFSGHTYVLSFLSLIPILAFVISISEHSIFPFSSSYTQLPSSVLVPSLNKIISNCCAELSIVTVTGPIDGVPPFSPFSDPFPDSFPVPAFVSAYTLPTGIIQKTNANATQTANAFIILCNFFIHFSPFFCCDLQLFVNILLLFVVLCNHMFLLFQYT